MALSQSLNSYLEILVKFVLLIRLKKDILGVERNRLDEYLLWDVTVLGCLHLLSHIVLVTAFSFFGEWKLKGHWLACEIFANIFDLKKKSFDLHILGNYNLICAHLSLKLAILFASW